MGFKFHAISKWHLIGPWFITHKRIQKVNAKEVKAKVNNIDNIFNYYPLVKASKKWPEFLDESKL